jgi:hypothetical protein
MWTYPLLILQDDHGVTATLQTNNGEHRVRCRYLVAADGGHSFVRKSLQIGFEGETWKDERMFVGDVRVDGLDRDHWHSWSQHPEGWVALCPIPSTQTFQFQAQLPAGVDLEPSLEAFQQIVTERTGRTDLQLYDPTWLSLDRYRVKNAFLAGDRAPDAPILDESGNRIRLFDVFRSPRFVLIALGNQDSKELKKLEQQFQGDLQVCEIHSEPAELPRWAE